MAHISGHDRSQTLLFPESVDDSVDPDNPVRFIDAFVEGLDLTVAGFVGVEPKATGRPGYAPADLLKLYIYGYLNRVQSSRRLEREAGRNIEVMWLTGRLVPDMFFSPCGGTQNTKSAQSIFKTGENGEGDPSLL